MVLDVLHLLGPAAVISAECFEAAVAGDLVEAGLGEQKQCTARGLLQPEFDQGGRLLRIIYFGVHGIGMPGKRKESFGLHALDDSLPFNVLVARIGNMATRHLTRYEWAIQFDAKPLAKFTVIRQRAPDPRNRSLELNSFPDTVIRFHLKQPPGCILVWRGTKSNLLVACSGRPWVQRRVCRFRPCSTSPQISSAKFSSSLSCRMRKRI